MQRAWRRFLLENMVSQPWSSVLIPSVLLEISAWDVYILPIYRTRLHPVASYWWTILKLGSFRKDDDFPNSFRPLHFPKQTLQSTDARWQADVPEEGKKLHVILTRRNVFSIQLREVTEELITHLYKRNACYKHISRRLVQSERTGRRNLLYSSYYLLFLCNL